MSIKEEIKYFTENLNFKVAKNRSEQIKNLVERIGKYIQKLYDNKINQCNFDSQDLRSFTIKLAKVHKEMNKKIDFLEFEKRVFKEEKKNAEKIKDRIHLEKENWKAYTEQIKEEQVLMLVLQNIQWSLSKLNMMCTVLNVYEIVTKQDTEKAEKESAEILTHSIFEALIEASEL